jgi:hypothetical protein
MDEIPYIELFIISLHRNLVLIVLLKHILRGGAVGSSLGS